MSLLSVEGLGIAFGGLRAVDDVSFSVNPGEIVSVIGPNGAGKTTLFNLIAGAFPPVSGSIRFLGEEVTGLSSDALFHKGLVRTFQIPHEFHRLTALENLMMVPARQSGETLLNAWFRRGTVAAEEAQTRRRAEEVLQLLRLTHVRNELAGNLSGGQKKLLELGRVMMAEPRVVLLDEIAAGVNRTLLNDLAAVVERLNREEGLTFFVIEHDMDLIARLCDPVIVMAAGSVMVEGPMAAIRENPEVVEAYFGGGIPAAHKTADGTDHGEAH